MTTLSKEKPLLALVRPTASAPRLLEQVRNTICVRHYSIRTEEAYLHWIKRFILFHGKRHPSEMGPTEVETFLTHLAVKGRVSASTQNQALLDDRECARA
jgi:Phage integrase, N-terminal SAM-like domain